MALLYQDSFDHFGTTTFAGKMSAIGSAVAFSAGNGRNGTASLRVTNAGANGRVAFGLPTASGANAVVGFAVKLDALPVAAAVCASLFNGSTQQFNLVINTTGTITARRSTTTLATSAFALSTGTWYWVEFVVTLADGATGSYDVFVDGVSVINGSSVRTAQTGTIFNAFEFWNGVTQSVTYDLDDLYILDGTSGLSTRLGDRRVVASIPDGAGSSSAFTPTSGSNFQMVDEIPPDSATTEVVSDTVGHTDLHTYAAVGATGTVAAVQYVTWAKADQAGVRDLVAVCRIGATTYEHPTPQTLGGDWQHYRWIWENSPATATAWTVAEIDGAEFGYRIAA